MASDENPADRPVSRFEDPVALARALEILRRGYRRYLASRQPGEDGDDERDADAA